MNGRKVRVINNHDYERILKRHAVYAALRNLAGRIFIFTVGAIWGTTINYYISKWLTSRDSDYKISQPCQTVEYVNVHAEKGAEVSVIAVVKEQLDTISQKNN